MGSKAQARRIKEFLSTAYMPDYEEYPAYNDSINDYGDGRGQADGCGWGKGYNDGYKAAWRDDHCHNYENGNGRVSGCGFGCGMADDHNLFYGRNFDKRYELSGGDNGNGSCAYCCGYGHGFVGSEYDRDDLFIIDGFMLFGDFLPNIKKINGRDVSFINGELVAIVDVCDNVASGFIYDDAMREYPVYIAKRNNQFIFGDTVEEALSEPFVDRHCRCCSGMRVCCSHAVDSPLSIADRVDIFLSKFTDRDAVYPMKNLVYAYCMLTGLKPGKPIFSSDPTQIDQEWQSDDICSIDFRPRKKTFDRDEYTLREFIDILVSDMKKRTSVYNIYNDLIIFVKERLDKEQVKSETR